MRYRAPLLSLCFLAITTAGCADPAQRAQEARQLFTAQEPIKLPEGSRPNRLELADLNADGNPDLVAACTGKAGVCVLLGNGKGKFTGAAGSPFSAQTAAHLVAMGDFNGDKKLDVMAASHDDNGAYLLLGDGQGGLALTVSSPFTAFPVGKPHNHGLAVADMNGDGHPDVTLGHQDLGGIAVLLGDGKERLTSAPGSPFRLGRGFYPHAVGDVNGDGKPDVVAPDIMGAALVVGLGDGQGGLRAGASIRVKPRPFDILLADLNGDGKLDIAATHDDLHEVDVLLGDGQGRFTTAPGSPLRAGRQGFRTAAADFDGDGKKDLLVAGQGGFTVLFGDGAGAFHPRPESQYEVTGGAWGMAAGDVNRDGKPDVVICDADAGTVTVFLRK